MNLKSTVLLSIFAFLSACAPYAETFDCPPGEGVGCKSLSRINRMVEDGELPLETVPLESVPLKKRSLEKAPQETELKETVRKKPGPPLIEAKTGPIPLIKNPGSYKIPNPATHLKVWMAAYEDERGIFHAPSFLYVALGKDLHDK